MNLLGCVVMFFCIILLLAFGIRGILNPRNVRDRDINEKEKSWYFTKTWIGKSALKFEKERKDGVFNIWISSLIAIIMALLMLYFILSNIIQKGWSNL